MADEISYKDLLDGVPALLAKAKRDALLLIDNNIWDSISGDRLDAWLNNFVTQEEKLLSVFLLDNLIFRSSDQIKALLFNALESVLPNLINDNPWSALKAARPIERLVRRAADDYKVRLVPVIRNSDPPTKSGPLVARLYCRYVGVSDDFMIWSWMIKNNYEEGIRTFVFIDDVLGTGEQFSEFLDNINAADFNEAEFIYVPLLATEAGVSKVRGKFPYLKLSAVEMIDETYNFFKRPGVSNISDLKELYISVEKSKLNGRFLGRMSEGYSKLGLTFSYYHSTPNATLPLYWYEDENFFPLVKR